MLIRYESDKTLAEVEADLEQACADHKFGVLGKHDLRAKLNEKGQPYDQPCLVFEVCNPAAAHRALRANQAISTALPCRISVYESEDGRTQLATIRPTLLLDLFKADDLGDLAQEVESALDAIMRQAARNR